jgi:hypothetical protein
MRRAQNAVVRASKSLRGFVSAVECIPEKSKLTAEQIEEAAWAAALRAPAVQDVIPPGWFTTRQLAEKLNKALPTMGRLLAEAVAAGRCEVQHFRATTGSVTRPVPHYRPK